MQPLTHRIARVLAPLALLGGGIALAAPTAQAAPLHRQHLLAYGGPRLSLGSAMRLAPSGIVEWPGQCRVIYIGGLLPVYICD